MSTYWYSRPQDQASSEETRPTLLGGLTLVYHLFSSCYRAQETSVELDASHVRWSRQNAPTQEVELRPLVKQVESGQTEQATTVAVPAQVNFITTAPSSIKAPSVSNTVVVYSPSLSSSSPVEVPQLPAPVACRSSSVSSTLFHTQRHSISSPSPSQPTAPVARSRRTSSISYIFPPTQSSTSSAPSSRRNSLSTRSSSNGNLKPRGRRSSISYKFEPSITAPVAVPSPSVVLCAVPVVVEQPTIVQAESAVIVDVEASIRGDELAREVPKGHEVKTVTSLAYGPPALPLSPLPTSATLYAPSPVRPVFLVRTASCPSRISTAASHDALAAARRLLSSTGNRSAPPRPPRPSGSLSPFPDVAIPRSLPPHVLARLPLSARFKVPALGRSKSVGARRTVASPPASPAPTTPQTSSQALPVPPRRPQATPLQRSPRSFSQFRGSGRRAPPPLLVQLTQSITEEDEAEVLAFTAPLPSAPYPRPRLPIPSFSFTSDSDTEETSFSSSTSSLSSSISSTSTTPTSSSFDDEDDISYYLTAGSTSNCDGDAPLEVKVKNNKSSLSPSAIAPSVASTSSFGSPSQRSGFNSDSDSEDEAEHDRADDHDDEPFGLAEYDLSRFDDARSSPLTPAPLTCPPPPPPSPSPAPRPSSPAPRPSSPATLGLPSSFQAAAYALSKEQRWTEQWEGEQREQEREQMEQQEREQRKRRSL
ncbi:hypothetical protein JCM11641_002696 [Rhodosporidiobolus odoratus]